MVLVGLCGHCKYFHMILGRNTFSNAYAGLKVHLRIMELDLHADYMKIIEISPQIETSSLSLLIT